MALSSALFSGISGLSNLGNAMQVIGDNIANVNTVGFKGSSFSFQDLLSQAMFTRAGTSQVGRGTALSDIYATFEQGSFESTGNTTDLAIGGDGFFDLREAGSQSHYYSRAGNFRFDMDGYLVNPEGYVVQGWSVDANGNTQGSPVDVMLNSFTSVPESTDEITLITNLNKDSNSNSSILSSSWDGTADPPIAAASYDYQTTVKVYDSLGSTHDVTVYFDKITGSQWGYVITCNPSEDNRSGFANTASQGLMARGIIEYNEGSGALQNLTMSRLTGTTAGTSQAVTDDGTGTLFTVGGINDTIAVNNPETVTANSAMTITYTDGAAPGCWSVAAAGYANEGIMATSTKTEIHIDLDTTDANTDPDIIINLASAPGAANDTQDIDLTITGSTDWTAETPNVNGYFEFQADFIGGAATTQDVALDIGTRWNGTAFAPDSLASTQYASSSTTVYQSADGYGPGALQGVDVDVEGLITGVYSNGQVIPLYRISLAKFQSLQGLYKEGGNLYRETRQSGPAITGQPGTNGLGNIAPNSLEQSNVDIANEFVKMITTQRGFQANSKIITVTDQMLAELINLKR